MLDIIKLLIVSLSISMVTSQNLELFMQKTTLENSLRDKIYSEVGHVIDKSKFVVVVNLELVNNLADIDKNQLQNSSNQMTDLASQAPTGNSMDFIHGIQLSNSNTDSDIANQLSSPKAETIVNKGIMGNLGSMEIKKISVNFFLEESLASPTLDKTITTLVNGIVPMISNCNDCIRIETMQFQNSSEKSELALLRARIEKFEVDKRNEELTELTDELKDLKGQLSDLETDNDSYLEEFKLDKAFQRTQDSLRLAKLEENADAERVQLDTLLFKAQQKIDTVINARIESETETKKDLIDIIKYGQGSLSDEDNQGILGMKSGSSSDSTLFYLGLGAIIFFMFMLLFFKTNKKEVVYLKPKGGKKESKKEKKKSEVSEVKMEEISTIPETPTNPYATMAFEDENVIRAELKSLRQSAVSMSVNQREGATQIVKDWLSDGVGDSETEGEEG